MSTACKAGDVVVHTGKPEWGPGDVVRAESSSHEGKPCQRVTVRFSRAGLKTLSTAFATLRVVEEGRKEPEGATSTPAVFVPAMASASPQARSANEPQTTSSLDDPQERLTRERTTEALQQMPEPVLDAFLPVPRRVQAVLDLYKLWDRPAGVLDWATAQTGLRDPLAVMTRHELEQQMERFRVALDGQFKKLVLACQKADPDALARMLREAGPAAKAALRRVDAR